MKGKRLTAVMLAVCMLLTLVPTAWAAAEEHSYDENGFCSVCGFYEPAELNSAGVYEIGNAGQLYWFAALVNGDDTYAEFDAQNMSADAVLMNDIDLESREWTPIGECFDNNGYYSGTFNGGGYTVSGLYVTGEVGDRAFFGAVAENGIVQKLTIEGSVSGITSGGIAAQNYGKIINCVNKAAVSAEFGTAGGIVISNSGEISGCYNSGELNALETGGITIYNEGTIVDCYNEGIVTDTLVRAGGIVSHNLGTISNCYNVGEVNGTNVGSIAGYNSGTIENCYYLEGLASDSNATVKSAEEFASGEVAWLLNGSTSENVTWYQTLGTDSYPVLDGESVVYLITAACDGSEQETYANDADAKVHIYDETGFCADGMYEPAKLNDEGVYEIGNAGELFWFAALVNGDDTYAEIEAQNTGASAVLMNDIDLTGYEWTPIGDFGHMYNYSYFYGGTFDGCGYTVTGLYINDSSNAGYEGLFGYVSGGTIKNLTLEDAYVTASDRTGAIAGCIEANSLIENCTVSAEVIVTSGESAGGIAGVISNSTIKNCTAADGSSVKGTEAVGGILGYASSGAVVRDSVSYATVSGTSMVGGVAGYAYYATIERCGNCGDVVGGTNYTGGVVGYLSSGVAVTDVYNTGSVSGSAYVGGVVGRLGNNSLTYAYNTGDVTGNTAGAVIGYINGSSYSVNNCYYLEGCADAKVGSGSIAYSALTVKTAEAFASGEVCYLLNGSSSDSVTWYQAIGEDGNPVLDSESGVVYLSTYCDGTDAGYTNVGEIVHSFDENGFCECGEYQPAEMNENGAYEINNIGKFYWFAALVNGDSTYAEFDAQDRNADAVLTQDLDFEGYDNYVPIGYTDLDYSSSSLDYVGYGGVFDGQGHVIKNLTITNDDTVSGLVIVGIFGTVTGTVRMLGVENFSFDRAGGDDGRFGAIAGQVIKNSAGDVGRIENCYVINSTVYGDSRIAGAIAGANYGGEIESCYVYGCDVQAYKRYGYFVGDNENDEGTLLGELINCYSDANLVGTTNTPRVGTVTGGEANISAERFASGEIAWLLNGEVYDNAVWHQTIGEDSCPLFEGGAVYEASDLSYTNDPCEASMHTFDEDGFCTLCGDYEPAEMNGEGVYEIENAGQLFWFAALVNGDNTYAEFDAQNLSANAVLMKDIDLENRAWTPIGNMYSSVYYDGTFNGSGYTVSGLYVSVSGAEEDGGFFSAVGENGIVKNLTVDGSVGGDRAGGIAAGNFGKITDCVNNAAIDGDVSGGIVYYNYSGGEIRGCYNNGEMNAYVHAGGIAAYNEGTIADCYNAGSLTAGYEAGGIVLDNGGTISNCYNVGSVSGSDVGGVVGNRNSGTIENCYYLEGTAEDSSATEKSAEEFASGEVAWLLNGGQSEDVVWYQTIGTDEYPVLDDESGVVYAKTDCGGTAEGYANSESTDKAEHSFDEDGFCSVCGDYESAEPNSEGVYEIKNAGQIFWFAALVNGDTTHAEFDAQNMSADAVLINDIDLESREWTPIGECFDNNGYYSGTFDGSGHSVSGLYVTGEVGDRAFFGAVAEYGIVQNLTIEGSVSGITSGGIAAQNYGKIINCVNKAAVSAEFGVAGGIANSNSGEIRGCYNSGELNALQTGGITANNEGTIVDCYNEGIVTATLFEAGGIASYNLGTISNCYNVGEVNGTDAVSIADYNSGTIENCYYLEGLASDSNATVKSAEEFASGEVAWLLQGGEETLVWGQSLGEDSHPVLSNAQENKVVKITFVFTADGSEEYEYINYNTELTDFPTAENVEYAFYTDAECTEKIDTGAAIVEDVTIYVAVDEKELGVKLVQGAQIRIGTGVTADDRTGEESGLRFIAYVDTTGTLAAEASEVGIAIYDGGFGTEDKVKEIMAKLTEEDVPITKIKAEKYQNDTVFTAAIVNISEANYNRAYIAVPYAVVEGVTYYDFDEAVARSPYQVAAGLLVSGATTSGYAQSASGETLTNVLNAYANETGARITLTYSAESGFGVAEAEYANGAVAFFTAECEDITDESGSVTGAKITLKAAGGDVLFYDYWKEYIRINNNNSSAVTHIENAEISDDKSTLTFEFYLQ
ncbi:MAG: hypothetical protein LUG52_09445 [Clostridia bacterium]|nr:hypothetical protein [Clostridia bacterium]